MKKLAPSDTHQTDLDHIGLYNLKVANYLAENPLTPLLQERIKHFKNNAQKDKLSDAAYNKAVEEFNQLGYFLPKRHVKYNNAEIDKNYSYINYPYIDTDAFRETMRNYRQYVYEYNNQAKEHNKTVKKYNLDFIAPEKGSDLEHNCNTLKAKYNSLFTKNYNKKIEEANARLGKVCIKKKNIQTIKYGTELFFNVILGFYTKQLRKFTETQLKLNLPTTIKKNGLKQVQIDQRKLATHKIDDIPRLSICKKTAQNHVKRLREAGILTHYVYSNQFHAIKVSINNKLLVVLDGKLPKSQNAEKQLVNGLNGKKLPDNSDTTRTYFKEKEKKDDVFNIGSLISGSGLQSLKTMSADSYKNTRRKQPQKNEDFSPTKNGKSSRISINARNLIIDDDKVFAQDLSANIYNNYTVLRQDRLLKYTQYSDLTSLEFKKLLIQDIIKQSAKIWKNHNVYVGNWKKTINTLSENLFKNITQKETMVHKLMEYRWKINFARKWFLKNKQVQALFPYQYFDPTRKTTNEIGFYGLHYAWKTHLNYTKNRLIEHKKLQIDANARKRKISNDKKMQNVLTKYFTGKISYEKMYDYIQDNLPVNYMDSLEEKFKNYNKLAV